MRAMSSSLVYSPRILPIRLLMAGLLFVAHLTHAMEYGLYLDKPLSPELEEQIFPTDDSGRPDWIAVSGQMGEDGFALLDRVRSFQTKGAVLLDPMDFRGDKGEGLDQVFLKGKDYAWQHAGRTDCYVIGSPDSMGSESVPGRIAMAKALALGLAQGDVMATVRLSNVALYPSPAQDLALMSGMFWYGAEPVMHAVSAADSVSGAHIDWIHSVWEGARLKKWVPQGALALWVSMDEPVASHSGRTPVQLLMDAIRICVNRQVGLLLIRPVDPGSKVLSPACSRLLDEVRRRGNAGTLDSSGSTGSSQSEASSMPTNSWSGVSGSDILSGVESYTSHQPQARGDLPFAWDSAEGGWGQHRTAESGTISEGSGSSGWAGSSSPAETDSATGATGSDSMIFGSAIVKGSPVVIELLTDSVPGTWSPSGLEIRMDSKADRMGMLRVWNFSTKAIAGAILTGGRRVGDRLKLETMGSVDVPIPLDYDRVPRISLDGIKTQSVTWQPDRPDSKGDSGRSHAVYLIRESSVVGAPLAYGSEGWQLLPGKGQVKGHSEASDSISDAGAFPWATSDGVDVKMINPLSSGDSGRIGFELGWRELKPEGIFEIESAVKGLPRNGAIRIGLAGEKIPDGAGFVLNLTDRNGQVWSVRLDFERIMKPDDGVLIRSFEFRKVSGGSSHLRNPVVVFPDVNEVRIRLEGLATSGEARMWMEVLR